MDSKNALKSMTVQGLVVLVLLHFLPTLGIKWDESQIGSLVEDILTVAALIWAFIGRLRASTTLTLAPKKATTLLLVAAVIPCALLAGCAGKSIPATTIRALGMDVGYAVYRWVPEARPVLSGVCLLSGLDDATKLHSDLRDSLEQIWVEAADMTSQDSDMVILGLNNLVGTLDLCITNSATAEQILSAGKTAVAGICDGLARASGGS